MLIAIYSWNHMRSFAVGIVVWFGLAFTLSSRGFFQGTSGWADDDIVGFIVFGTLMTLPLIGFALAWMRSARLREFLKSIPLSLLIGIEVYRAAGAVFWWMYTQEMMPPAIGIFTGFADVFIGVTALPLAWALARKTPGTRRFAIAWNLFGISDFVIAVRLFRYRSLGW